MGQRDRARVVCQAETCLGRDPLHQGQMDARENLFPWSGSRPIAEITPPELLTTLRRIEGRARSRPRSA